MSTWTKESPTVDGYYWWRGGPSDDDEELVLVRGAEVLDTRLGESSPWKMINHQGEWIGPLRREP